MSIADKLTQLDNIRSSMRTKLVAKGVDASTHDFADFPSDVESIPSGGGFLDVWHKMGYTANIPISITVTSQEV